MEEKNEGHGSLYVQNFCEFLLNQVKLFVNEDIMFHIERNYCSSEVISANMTITFFSKSYDEVRWKMMESFDSCVMYGERRNRNKQSLVGFVRTLSDKRVKTLNRTAFVVYPVHTILLQVSQRKTK